jgi:hypothetical protein
LTAGIIEAALVDGGGLLTGGAGKLGSSNHAPFYICSSLLATPGAGAG